MATTTKNKTTNASDLKNILVMKVGMLLDMETELIKIFSKMGQKASDADLKEGFEDHLEETRVHVERLEKVYKILDVKPQKIHGNVIRGLAADAEWVIKNIKTAEALDAGLVAMARCIEHYEIAGYGPAVEWARLLDLDEVAELLEETLEEEAETDEMFSDLAESKIDEAVLGEKESDDEDEDSDEEDDEDDE